MRNDIGPYMQKLWLALGDHPLVGEVRMVGLIGALELIQNKKTRASWPVETGTVGMIARDHSFANGLVMRATRDTLIIAPAARHHPWRSRRADRERQEDARRDLCRGEAARLRLSRAVQDALAGIDATRAKDVHAEEAKRYAAARPRCKALSARLGEGFYDGVPMHWMRDWPMPFPLIVTQAQGATLTDVDGHRLADFCLGDTGSMFGHSPPPVVAAIRASGARPDHHAADRGRGRGRPAARRTLRPAALADRDDRHRRQPLCAARSPAR